MRKISYIEIEQVMRECSVFIDNRNLMQCSTNEYPEEVSMLSDSRYAAIATWLIVDTMFTNAVVVLWIYENGVWPTEENTVFLNAVAKGCDVDVSESPLAFSFNPKESVLLQGWIRWCIYSGYGIIILSKADASSVSITHDRLLKVVGQNAVSLVDKINSLNSQSWG